MFLSFPAVAYNTYLQYNFPIKICSVGYFGNSKLALEPAAYIVIPRNSLLRLLKIPPCSLQGLLMIPAYSSDSMATAQIRMSNFEWLLTRLKGQ